MADWKVVFVLLRSAPPEPCEYPNRTCVGQGGSLPEAYGVLRPLVRSEGLHRPQPGLRNLQLESWFK